MIWIYPVVGFIGAYLIADEKVVSKFWFAIFSAIVCLIVGSLLEFVFSPPIHLAGHQYEWAKHELNAWEREPGVFEHEGVRFMKQVRGVK